MKKVLFFLILGIVNLLFGGFYRLPVAVIFSFICIAAFIIFSCGGSDESKEEKNIEVSKQK